ncbi:MAG: AAA family ATPase [Clostridia bacterium]|nr:AAA family ATPase [Clostridia bacterium]
MSIYRISFMLRAMSINWDYKAANSRDLADDLVGAMEKALSPAKPVHSRKGSIQHHFYIASDISAEENKSIAYDALEKLIPDEEMRKLIVVSVTEPDENEMENLRTTVNVDENPAFWSAVQACVGVENKKPSEEEMKLPAPKGEETNEESDDPKESAPKEDLPLLKRIAALKSTLLEKVRGQRHSVDEFVQGIFECEMFSADNPDRKGPLATFLFTGPSGVGKTYLATLASKLLGRGEPLIVDMSEYSDNLANGKFNGEYGRPAVVTKFVREHPDGIIIFDEIEKAHINTIHLFLQILDGARLKDYTINKEVSFRNNIIIMTTNAGKGLYDDTSVCDLSMVPRQVIIDGLRKDVDPQSGDSFFPECIITRMANGRVLLFNHLEPYALLQIVKDEIATQVALFEKSSGIKVNYDPETLAALVLYNSGGVSDARSLRGQARNIVSRELQEVLMQIMNTDEKRVDSLKEITLNIDTRQSEEIANLFTNSNRPQVVTFTDNCGVNFAAIAANMKMDFTVLSDEEEFKRRIRSVTDFVLLDPLCGNKEKEQAPSDVEDVDSAGMRMFEYIREFMPEVPIYILDTTGKVSSFDTILAQGARGVICVSDTTDDKIREALKDMAFGALVNNSTFALGRSNKFLSFNCAQYLIDESCAVVSFERLKIKGAMQVGDSGVVTKKGDIDITFADVIGCKEAKEALCDYRDMLEDPRKNALKGKKMPKGVLLYGPPGTGKTLLAKAMANECNTAFFQTSASAFFGPLVGQTESNIRSLFQKARKYAPSIIFIDEVDAIGRMRTGAIGSTHSEDALNMFLAEMDGFTTDEKRPVFIMAATNYDVEGDSGKVLDSAFVRRFARKILIPLPDTDDRYELLKKSLKKHGIDFGDDHDKILKNMAERTAGMNNADLEMVNDNYARILGDGTPDGAAYMDSLDAYRFGEVNDADPDHLRQTACHEAGHALVCRLCGVTPSFLTVVSRGNFGGYMESAVENKHGTYTYQELMDRVCRCLAGRVAEIEVYGDTLGTNTGASSDIKMARYYMKTSLNEYAMGDKLYARWTQDEIEQQMREQYERTRKMIRDNRGVLDALTDRLVQEKSMDKTQLEKFFESMNV